MDVKIVEEKLLEIGYMYPRDYSVTAKRKICFYNGDNLVVTMFNLR